MTDIHKFACESNAIEGERFISKYQFEALEWFLEQPLNEKSVLEYHRRVAENLPKQYRGVYRDREITIGGKPAGDKHYAIQNEMDDFFKRLPKMNSWEAHNLFEKIHPFADYNGRTGRAIWLWKVENEAKRDVRSSFLQDFYYQTLEHFTSKK